MGSMVEVRVEARVRVRVRVTVGRGAARRGAARRGACGVGRVSAAAAAAGKEARAMGRHACRPFCELEPYLRERSDGAERAVRRLCEREGAAPRRGPRRKASAPPPAHARTCADLK